ncbi:4-galactosyl-N-acetylglucosaminide 3-alpha-L-fucosyltransferase FUT6-like [Ambystoma mexicanum]|uniref:4-galactosyl-N-acetylglucosaminide 3-alpha-L-fucosyltransferase FUT6-like n=1 Tax=Ambystoma mexicanum TaxID=8296 RepID=UPI0037E8D04A
MEPKSQTSATRKILFLFFLQFFTVMCVFSYIRISKEPGISICLSEMTNNTTIEERAEPKVVILLWTWPFGERFPLDKCDSLLGISGCYFTVNRTLYKKADAVIFHYRDLRSSREELFQEPRFTFQRWVWFNMESPSNLGNLEPLNNLFNVTMSYRQDSDIFTPYGWLELLKEPENFTIPPKSKLVSWVISNWNPNSRRVQYYEELKKHVKVDLFGRVAQPLAKINKYSTISQYKFYLAFENSVHKDYITEKLWDNALLSGTVPIVLGPTRENYERFLPSDAFIHVDDFPSAQELASYLKLLDSDDEQYQRYFKWRGRFQVKGDANWPEWYCKACQYLSQNPFYRITPSVAKWFA